MARLLVRTKFACIVGTKCPRVAGGFLSKRCISSQNKQRPNISAIAQPLDITSDPHLAALTKTFQYEGKDFFLLGTTHAFRRDSIRNVQKFLEMVRPDHIVLEVVVPKGEKLGRHRHEFAYAAHWGYERNIPVRLGDPTTFEYYNNRWPEREQLSQGTLGIQSSPPSSSSGYLTAALLHVARLARLIKEHPDKAPSLGQHLAAMLYVPFVSLVLQPLDGLMGSSVPRRLNDYFESRLNVNFLVQYDEISAERDLWMVSS